MNINLAPPQKKKKKKLFLTPFHKVHRLYTPWKLHLFFIRFLFYITKVFNAKLSNFPVNPFHNFIHGFTDQLFD